MFIGEYFKYLIMRKYFVSNNARRICNSVADWLLT